MPSKRLVLCDTLTLGCNSLFQCFSHSPGHFRTNILHSYSYIYVLWQFKINFFPVAFAYFLKTMMSHTDVTHWHYDKINILAIISIYAHILNIILLYGFGKAALCVLTMTFMIFIIIFIFNRDFKLASVCDICILNHIGFLKT